jgi:hypothetical protein
MNDVVTQIGAEGKCFAWVKTYHGEAETRRKAQRKPLKRGGTVEAEDIRQFSYRGLTRMGADKDVHAPGVILRFLRSSVFQRFYCCSVCQADRRLHSDILRS